MVTEIDANISCEADEWHKEWYIRKVEVMSTVPDKESGLLIPPYWLKLDIWPHWKVQQEPTQLQWKYRPLFSTKKKISSYMVLQVFYLYHRNSYTGEIAFLFWEISTFVVKINHIYDDKSNKKN